MFLKELFDNSELKMINHLRSEVMDYLTPLAAQNVEALDISEIQKMLQKRKTGIVIDRMIIMQLIDPDTMGMVKKIEGNKVFLKYPIQKLSSKTERDEEKDKKKIAKKASDKAKKNIKDKGNGILGDGK